MRTFVTAIIGAAIAITATASFAGGGCASCNGESNRAYRSYQGPACYSPPGFCMSPGCCECPPSACDNAWDGYCEEKARWQAFWTRFGTPKPSGSYCGPARSSCSTSPYCVTPNAGCATETVRPTTNPTPTPAAPGLSPQAAPAPAPPKSTDAAWKATYPWMR